MAGLKQIKNKIRSTEKTRKVTKAMEAVSAAKMRKAQSRALAGRAYARAAVSILARISGSRELAHHPLTAARNVKRALYIVITSDKGLAGALNSGVLRAVERDMGERGFGAHNTNIIAVGRKANDAFSRRGFAIESAHQNTDESLPREMVERITGEAAMRFAAGEVDLVRIEFAAGEVDLVRIAFQNFRSTFEQRPTVRTLFPLTLADLEQMVEDITPKRGPHADEGEEAPAPSIYTVEPSEEEVMDAILPKLAGIFVYHALLESQASEHSARMVAMKSASDKGAELQHALTLKFNKARQAAITREVSEITGGMEAMAD